MTYANASVCINLCLNLFIDYQTAVRKSEGRKFDRRYMLGVSNGKNWRENTTSNV
jgi:hypothetical protein